MFKEACANTMKGGPKRAAIVFSLAAILVVALILSIALLNITMVTIYVDGELKTIHLMWGERDLKLSFNSSITGTPVTIHFKITHGRIRGHALEADEAMIEYYSMGMLNVSTTVKGYESRNIEFCSTQNFKIIIGDMRIKLKNTCIRVEAHSIWSLIKHN